MPHILILEEAIEALAAKDATPPTLAQTNLMEALQDANEYAHSPNPDLGALDDIEGLATSINYYIGFCASPPTFGQDVRLNGFADDMQEIIPG